MILFYEGLRPVLAKRITYWRDPIFTRRLLPPPDVPRLDIVLARPKATTTAPDSNEGSDSSEARQPAVRGVLPQGGGRVAERDPTEIPKGRSMTDSEVRQAADRFLAGFGE